MNVVIIDYGSGNLRSAAKAFERAVAEGGLGMTVRVTNDPDTVRKADRVVLPGVGAFGDCRNGLNAVPGLHDALDDAVMNRGVPYLGICVGMQLMATRGLEHGITEGFDWIGGAVTALVSHSPSLKIPHMGWNTLEIQNPHPVLEGLAGGWDAYFVHSFHLRCTNPDHLLATVQYGQTVTAVVGRDNLVGTQFHPEKSQAVGLRLIGNFLRWTP